MKLQNIYKIVMGKFIEYPINMIIYKISNNLFIIKSSFLYNNSKNYQFQSN